MLKQIKRLLPSKSNSKELLEKLEQTLYQKIGGEKGTLALSNAFYDEMEKNIHLRELLAIHKQPLDGIRIKFFEFLSGWLGGPGLYVEKYGHPQLRARHMPFKVTKKQSSLWMLCMNNALNNTVEDERVKTQMRQAFAKLAVHMVNC
ncbi:group II truncated hemoglobin [Litorilituus lipolyticus]|uniref:Hemoglobin-like oxygen-binding protein n=1 Tax=Litorilituus lipolyticus TaxID=2491017 RepID=A0A502KNM3_9GAMM|nr:group II truncated hemoglobin [Litorilituus lipolyticus]TPH13208.1 hemoglobin-like oxygen-binding protein [Litorilituus lipolyticus]